MGEISADLLKFRSSVSGSIGGMNSCCDNIVSKINSLSSGGNSLKSAVSSLYNSENKEIVLGTFDSLKSAYSTIESSVNGTLRGYISSSEALISEVDELDKINTQIAELKSKMNSIKGDTDTESYNRNNYQNQINTLETQFNEKHEKAKSDLNVLKSKSDTVTIGQSSGSSSSISQTASNDIVTKGGTFTEKTYKASNGKTVNYWIYLPKVEDTTTKLPMLVYFHGMGDTINQGNGLPAQIQKKNIVPKGIVIFPQAYKGTKDSEFRNKDYQKAVIELAYDVAEKYNGDKKRISVAGHSNGACAVYTILNNYPGTFSAAAPISGACGTVSEGVKKTYLYALMGKRDRNLTWSSGINIAKKSKEMGYDALYAVFENRGHDMQSPAFLEDIEDENGKKVKLLDWLMSKTLKS